MIYKHFFSIYLCFASTEMSINLLIGKLFPGGIIKHYALYYGIKIINFREFTLI